MSSDQPETEEQRRAERDALIEERNAAQRDVDGEQVLILKPEDDAAAAKGLPASDADSGAAEGPEDRAAPT